MIGSSLNPQNAVVCVALVAILGVPATSRAAADTERLEITCQESRILIAFPTLPGQGECLKWQHYLHEALFRKRSQQYHRFERFEGGFVNIRYLEAGAQKTFLYADFRQELESRFRSVREDASGFIPRRETTAGGHDFEVAQFDLPKDRRCTGFLARWLRIYDGWKHKIVGYACRVGKPLDDSDMAVILEGIEIGAGEPRAGRTQRPRTTTSGAYPYEAVFTSMVFKTQGGQELADELDEIALNHGLIYLYIKWRGLSQAEHRADLTITDGEGREVHSTYYAFTPRTDNWNNWWDYRIDAENDAPGRWTFAVLLDGEPVFERYLTVRPERLIDTSAFDPPPLLER